MKVLDNEYLNTVKEFQERRNASSNYKITKTWSDDKMIEGFSIEKRDRIFIPTTRVVPETYGDRGVYIKRISGLELGMENRKRFWSLNPDAGRMEYKIEKIKKDEPIYQVSLSKDIKFVVFWPEEHRVLYENRFWLTSIEDAIGLFYLENAATRSPYDMSYVFGARQMRSEFVPLDK